MALNLTAIEVQNRDFPREMDQLGEHSEEFPVSLVGLGFGQQQTTEAEAHERGSSMMAYVP